MKTSVIGLVGVVFAMPVLAGPDEFPRTASGKPDFSGRYDIATLTPYTRRGGPDAEPYIEAEVAAQREDGAVRRYENSMRDRDPNRAPPAKGANVDARSYDPVWFDQGLSMFEIDGKIPASIVVDPPNGQMPPPSEAAIARGGRVRRTGTNDGAGSTTRKTSTCRIVAYISGTFPFPRCRSSTTTSRPSCRPRIT